MQGTLYFIPTPIGNLKDITLRSLEILREVDLILAEDTRTSSVLLNHYHITTPRKSYHIFNEHASVEKIVGMLKDGQSIGLISDAGTPGISDPGFLLAREALKSNIKLEVLPGASAFLPALIKSGFPTDRFIFEGFLPHKKGRKSRIESLVNETRTMIFYESPHRIVKALEQFNVAFPGRKISVSRELTKKFEETITDEISVVLEHFRKITPKGEFVIIVEGGDKKN